MKLDGLDHPKTLDLCARLDAPLPLIVGHLELLWAFVATKTPQGNVGKWPNGAIARGAHWQGDPDEFVSALASAGFLDEDSEHRYLVHDWAQHAPSWVRSKLNRNGGLGFITENRASEVASRDESSASADGSRDASADSARAVPHATPRHAMPSEETNGTSADADETVSGNRGYPDDFECTWAEYPKREGGNPKKAAFKAWKARRNAGVSADELLAATRHYAQHCQAHGKTGTAFVKQGATFYGPDEHYAETYSTRPPKSADRDKSRSHSDFESREYTSHIPDWAKQFAGSES